MSNVIPVFKGDRVHVMLDITHLDEVGEVTKVIRRFGWHNGGTTPPTPLICIKKDNGEEQYVDGSLVVEVLSRRCVPTLPYNHFREEVIKQHPYWSRLGGGTYYEGFAVDILNFVLANMNIGTGLGFKDSLVDALMKQTFVRPVGHEYMHDFIRTPKKKLRRWLRQNINRHLYTARELEKLGTEDNKEMEQEYWESVDHDYAYDDFLSDGTVGNSSEDLSFIDRIDDNMSWDAPVWTDR